MSHSFTCRPDGVSVPANDNPAPESWDAALAADLAILGPIGDAFGWLCAWSAPGAYTVGRYDVVWHEGTREPYWKLSYQASDLVGADRVDVARAWRLDTIAAVIVNDAATRLEFRAALCEPYDYKRPEQPACNKETNNISHGVP